jgi:hypothetical protein
LSERPTNKDLKIPKLGGAPVTNGDVGGSYKELLVGLLNGGGLSRLARDFRRCHNFLSKVLDRFLKVQHPHTTKHLTILVYKKKVSILEGVPWHLHWIRPAFTST